MAHSTLQEIPEQVFTEKTIREMFRLIDRAKTDAEFQKLIYGLVNAAMPRQWKDYRRELSVVFNWYKNNIDYRRDPHGVELLQDVWATLDRKRGDCDDATIWLGAAAGILGSPIRIVTVSTRRDKSPNHVYPEALVGGSWLGLDATVQGSSVGWTPPSVTARKVWTRREVGLSGSDDELLEGLGMTSENGYGNDGFGTNMRPVSRYLAPGVPDDISNTFAAPIPGVQVDSRRRIDHAPIANVSDRTSNPRAGGGVYNPALPIKSMPTPRELWMLVDRLLIPKVLSPDNAWWNAVPTAKEEFSRMFPGSEITMNRYLDEIASVPESTIAGIAGDVVTLARLGEISGDEVDMAVGQALEDAALGRMGRPSVKPRIDRLRERIKQKRAPRNGRPSILPQPPHEKRYLVPGPQRHLLPVPGPYVKGGGLNGLGSITDAIADIAKTVSNAVVTGVVPGDATSVNKAIDQAINQTITKPAPATSMMTVAKTAIPMGTIALLAGVAWLMTRGGGKYRSNPSGRRGGHRRSRGRGMSTNNLLLMAAAGGAAWYLLLRPGATLLPRAPQTVQSVISTPSTSDAMKAAAIKAAPSVINDTIKLFSSLFAPSTPSALPEDNSWSQTLVVA